MTVSATAKFGNVAATSISNSPAVGVVYSPSLSFSPDNAGKPTYISIAFILGMAMEWQETFTLHLPGFFSSQTNFEIQSTLKRRFDKATWDPQSQNMVLTAEMPVFKGSVINETFRTMINLPLDGIRWYSTGFTLSTSAQVGPIPPTIIPNFNAVGSMRYTELRVEPHIPGARVAITIIFRPRQILRKGSTVEIVLTGFSGKTWAGVEYGGNGSGLIPEVDSHPAILHATWVETDMVDSNKTSPLLTLFLSDSVSENALVIVRLSARYEIKMPAEGLLPNIASFTIASEQVAGSVAPTQLWRSPGIQLVGRIINSAMTYHGNNGPHANAPIELELNFTATVTIFPGDVIALALPKFTSLQELLTVELSHSSSRSGGLETNVLTTQATWYPQDEVLALQVNYELPGAVQAKIIVPRDMGLTLPMDGVNRNQDNLRMWVMADAGNVPSTAIMTSPAIGSVSVSSSVTFQPAAADDSTNITLSFSTNMQVQRGEEVRLKLPFFVKDPYSPLEFDPLDASSTFPSALWDSESHTVIFRCNRTLQETFPVTMLLPFFTVGTAGVRRNQPSITLASDAVDGPMLPTTVFRTQGIGSMTNSTFLSFDPIGANIDLDLTFEFVPEMDLSPGDLIVLHLPDFYRGNLLNEGLTYQCLKKMRDSLGNEYCSGEHVCVSDLCHVPLESSSAPFEALQALRWREMQSVVRTVQLPFLHNDTGINLTTGKYYSRDVTVFVPHNISFLERVYELEILVAKKVSRGIVARVTVLKQSHLRGPKEGLNPNDPNVTVKAACAEGDMPVTSVVSTLEIGSYQVSELVYSFAQAAQISGISFTFSTTISIDVNDTLTLVLPNFQQDGPSSFDVVVFVQLSEEEAWTKMMTVRSKGAWLVEDQHLAIIFGEAIAAKTVFKLVIDPSAGIRLPNGIIKNSPTLQVMLNSANGFILPGPIAVSMAIGAFSSTNLSFPPGARAGESAAVIINLRMTMQLQLGEGIEIYLPEFVANNITGPEFSVHIALDDVVVSSWSAQWFQSNFTISIHAGQITNTGEQITITMPKSLGFIIPFKGVVDEVQQYLNASENVRTRADGKISLKAGNILFFTFFRRINPIGSFWPQSTEVMSMPGNALGRPSISFLPAVAPTSRNPAPSLLKILFQPQMPIEVGEEIEFTCLNFQGESQIFISLAGQSEYFVSASWHYSGSGEDVQQHLLLGHNVADRTRLSTNTVGVLRLVASAFLPAQTSIVLQIPASAGIKLPHEGVPRDTVWVQTRARGGPVVATPMFYLPVGSFTTSTSLQYSNKRAGQFTDIVFRFTAAMPILQDEFIILSLPYWQAPGRDFLVASTPPGFIVYSSWTSTFSELEFTARRDIPANTSLTVAVSLTHAPSCSLALLRARRHSCSRFRFRSFSLKYIHIESLLFAVTLTLSPPHSHAHAHMCTRTRAHTCIYIYKRVHLYVYMGVCEHICMYASFTL